MRSPGLANTVALVPAAGGGSRLGLGHKAFLKLGDQTLLTRVTQLLSTCVSHVIVGVPHELKNRARRLVSEGVEIRNGGESRGETIAILFEHLSAEFIVVHDVACPFAPATLVRDVIAQARKSGAAAAFLPPVFPTALLENGRLTGCLPKAQSALVRSPLAFERSILKRLMEMQWDKAAGDLSLAERCSQLKIPIAAVPCDETNIKITTSLDWEIACKVIAPKLDQSAARQIA